SVAVNERLVVGRESTDGYLGPDEIYEIVAESVESVALGGKRVLVIIPDGTRTMPMPLMFEILQKLLRPRVKKLDYLVALGTHPLMSDAQDRKSTRLNSSHVKISYAVFCLKKKRKN